MVADHAAENPGATWEHSVTDLRPIADQLDEYFSGTRTEFRVPLDPVGSDFQGQVWRALLEIPFGQTRTYGEIAKAIGQPNAARAVGLANNQNPLAILVPCHRVIGADGKLVGYAGGVARKKSLLALEAHFGKLDPVDLNRVIASAKVKVARADATNRNQKPPARKPAVAAKSSARSTTKRTAGPGSKSTIKPAGKHAPRAASTAASMAAAPTRKPRRTT